MQIIVIFLVVDGKTSILVTVPSNPLSLLLTSTEKNPPNFWTKYGIFDDSVQPSRTFCQSFDWKTPKEDLFWEKCSLPKVT